MKKILISGSHGLVGAEAVKFYAEQGWKVIGIDIDIRQYLFGEEGSTSSVGKHFMNLYPNYFPISCDLRDYTCVEDIFKQHGPFDYIFHLGAQPSHEWSINNALEDFYINSVGTINMLEAYRQHSPEAAFIYSSSSKVYGDSVNSLPLKEYDTRFDLPIHSKYYFGVDEDFCKIDGIGKSLFGNSKACGDLTCQEYANYFDLPIGIFRPVCISGSKHKGTPMHGYLAYLVKCVAEGREYIINGYKGKQVRDNIHASDLVRAFDEFCRNPKKDGIYSIGAGRKSNNSILEALLQAGDILGKDPIYSYSEVNRKFDHMWCIYSASKFRRDYPNWEIEYDNNKLMQEICSQYE